MNTRKEQAANTADKISAGITLTPDQAKAFAKYQEQLAKNKMTERQRIARDRVILAKAASQGITATDDEIQAELKKMEARARK